MDIEQNIELRRKFKRDYQKHKRQIALQKDCQNDQKKKSKKLLKVTEDFDEFIEQKIVQIKQMFALEVLEPLLSTFFGICSLYGNNEKIKNQFLYQRPSRDDFGKVILANYVDVYSMEPYGSNNIESTINLTSFQNKFYDEEFKTVNLDTRDRLFQFINNLKHLHLQPPSENINVVPRSPLLNEWENQSILSIPYPEIKIESYYNLNNERISPTLSIVNPKYFGKIPKFMKKKPFNLKKR